mmetsp:Transcript_14168/g.28560  ORF Transcript_14168/g.28560 Transcript_14168/m.28560 type:complete len:118 (+) Transcript_14168:981-1334(+)
MLIRMAYKDEGRASLVCFMPPVVLWHGTHDDDDDDDDEGSDRIVVPPMRICLNDDDPSMTARLGGGVSYLSSESFVSNVCSNQTTSFHLFYIDCSRSEESTPSFPNVKKEQVVRMNE